MIFCRCCSCGREGSFESPALAPDSWLFICVNHPPDDVPAMNLRLCHRCRFRLSSRADDYRRPFECQVYEPPTLTPLGRAQDLLAGFGGSKPEGKSGKVGML